MLIYSICTQYLVGFPFALITASIRRGMEVISLWHCAPNERLNDSLNKTAYHLHLRSLSTNQSNLFKTLFLNQSKHILIFIQELCIYKTITFYDSSLVIKKNVAYSRPAGRVGGAPHRLRTTGLKGAPYYHTQVKLFNLLN